MSAKTVAQLFSRVPPVMDEYYISHARAPASSTETERKILGIIHARWPTSSLEIAEFLGHDAISRKEKKQLSSRLSYHLQKLVEKKHIMSKRVGNARIVWPYPVEESRALLSRKSVWKVK